MRPPAYIGAPDATCPLSRGLSPKYLFHTSWPVFSLRAITRASERPANTMPSATATPSRPGAPMPVGAWPRPPLVWKRHMRAPVFTSNAYTDGDAVTKIIPSLTTVIAREETALSNRVVHAAPSFVTFDVVNCASVE